MQDYLALSVGLGAGMALFVGLWIMSQLTRPPAMAARQSGAAASILLSDGVVIDTSDDAGVILSHPPHPGQSWEELRNSLSLLFPDMPQQPPQRPVALDSPSRRDLSLLLEPADGRLLCQLRTPDLGARRKESADRDRADALRLRAALDATPQPIWQLDAEGRTVWFNAAYAQVCAESGIDPAGSTVFQDTVAFKNGAAVRARVPLAAGGERWFELTTRPSEAGTLHFATAIDTLVEAEMAQRTFVQTLTKTFAHLQIGLAVFDRDHRLVLFNPALVELTRLPVEFLSARPNLLSFFDHMRENRMMPEPKSYASWREQLAEVILAARDDRYSETWNLPSGLTYKITGRPHPDRAVAFLLEDISAEISLTRRFRSELELTQSVIDCFEDGVAVFSQLGVLTFSNAAYRRMWKTDPDSAFAEVTITDATQDWQRACEPSPIWADMRDFVLDARERAAWDAPLSRMDGTRLVCTVEPVAAGATMVRFSEVPATQPATVER